MSQELWRQSLIMCKEYFGKKIRNVMRNTMFYGEELKKLVEEYSKCKDKIRGRRIKGFVIEESKRFGCVSHKPLVVYIVFEDGSKTDFSIPKACEALFGKCEEIKKRDVLAAFRTAVDDQIKEFVALNTVDKERKLVKTYDGKILPRNQVDVHHATPFQRLVEEFLKLKNLRWEDVPLKDIGEGYDIADQKLREEWREFHKKHAKLVIVERKTHRRWF